MFGFKGTSVVESTGVQYKSAAPKTKIKRLVSLNRTRNFNFDLVLHYYINPPPHRLRHRYTGVPLDPSKLFDILISIKI